jgi:hypothetical protein
MDEILHMFYTCGYPFLRPRRYSEMIPVVPPRFVHALTPSIGMALMVAGISRVLGVGGRFDST